MSIEYILIGGQRVSAVNNGDGTYKLEVAGTGGGGGGGAALSDVVLTDAAGVLVLQRDDGTTRSFIRLDTGAAYTPTLPLTAARLPVSYGAGNTDANTQRVVLAADGPTNTNLAAISAKLPNTLGQKPMANALAVSIASDQSAVPVSVPGVSTEATLAAVNGKLPSTITSTPVHDVAATPSRLVGQNVSTAGFSAVGSSVLDTFFVQTPIVGSGVSYNQAAGALNIVAGTTANAEFLARSVSTFRGSMRMRHTLVASARVANSNFAVLLADLIGENLAVTVNSATSITVAIPGHTFDATNVGQSVFVGGIVGISGGVPGRYAIASVVAGVSITLTVSGWPASGSGTATVFGRNYVRNLFTGAAATSVNVDAQRNGWATGDTTAATFTSISPGLLLQCELTGREVFWANALRASATIPNTGTIASRYENIPDQNLDLYVFLWSFNGTTAPTAVTWTLGHLSIESYANVPVYIQGNRSLGQQNSLPVAVTTALPAGTNSIGNIGSITTLPSIPAGTSLIGDVGVQYRATATGAAGRSHIVSQATTNPTIVKASAGRVLGYDLSNTTAAWLFVKLHNQATAPTAGTGVVQTIGIPPNGKAALSMEGGMAFTTGIGLTIVTGAADADATAVTAGAVVGDVFFV